MTLYSLALFLHILGALSLFVLLTVEGITLRQGTVAAQFNRTFGPISALLILVPGIYMVVAGAGWAAWVGVGFVGWVVIAAIGAITGISLLRGRLSTRSAAISWSARVGMAVAVVFVMTAKPDLLASSIAVVAGVLAGLAGSLVAVRRVRRA